MQQTLLSHFLKKGAILTFPQKSGQSSLSYGGRGHGFYNMETSTIKASAKRYDEQFKKDRLVDQK